MTSNNRNNNRDNNKYNNYKVLDNLFRNYKVFIDTCSLMYYNPKAVKKLFVLISKLSHKYNNPLIIPYKVIWELQKHKRSNDPETYAKAKNALEILEHYRSEGNKCFEVYADDNDKEFADPVFLKVFQMYHLDFNRALITQDYDLSNDVLNLLKQKVQS